MIRELDTVVLNNDLDEYGLKKGDIGTIVLEHRNSAAFEVEFITLDGETVAVVTLLASQVRAIGKRELAHARTLSLATA